MITETYEGKNISIETVFNSGRISEKELIIGDGTNILFKQREFFCSKELLMDLAKAEIDKINKDKE